MAQLPPQAGKLCNPDPYKGSSFGFVLKWIAQKLWDGLQNQFSIYEEPSKEQDFCLILAFLV